MADYIIKSDGNIEFECIVKESHTRTESISKKKSLAGNIIPFATSGGKQSAEIELKALTRSNLVILDNYLKSRPAYKHPVYLELWGGIRYCLVSLKTIDMEIADGVVYKVAMLIEEC